MKFRLIKVKSEYNFVRVVIVGSFAYIEILMLLFCVSLMQEKLENRITRKENERKS